MHIENLDPFCEAVAKARELAYVQTLHGIHGVASKSPDALRDLIHKQLELSVQVVGIDLTAVRHVKAYYLPLPDGTFEVYVLEGQTKVWSDFCSVKELFHVALHSANNDACWSVDLYNHARNIVETLVPMDGEPNACTLNEEVAQVAAMEFLFPYSERLTVLKEYEGKQVDYERIAANYFLPSAMVVKYLARTNMATLGKVEKQLGPKVMPGTAGVGKGTEKPKKPNGMAASSLSA